METLSEMQKIVTKYKNTSLYHRAKYLLSSKSNLSNLDFKLSQQIQDLTTLITIINGLLTSQLQPLIEKVLQKQDEAMEKEEKRRAVDEAGNPAGFFGHSTVPESVPEKVHRVRTALNSVIESKPSDSKTSQQTENLVQSDIEVQLSQAGLGTTDISALIKMIDQQREKLTHPEDIDAASGAGGKQRLNGPTGWIMMVDNYNSGTTHDISKLSLDSLTDSIQVRSIIAQTYLELVRVWTVNLTGTWLFNRVESAGVQIATRFSSKHLPGPLEPGNQPPNETALNSIAGFGSAEKQDILARIRRHRSRGIDDWHFRKYDYMLCFNKSAYDRLQVLAASCKEKHAGDPSYPTPARIIPVSNLILNSPIENLDKKEVDILVQTIRDGIKNFLKQEFGWVRPQGSILDGPFRTKQIVLRPAKIMCLDPTDLDAELHSIAIRTECRIRITDARFDSQLVSITGREEALPFAVSLLKERFA